MVTKKDKHLGAAQKYLERGSLEKALTEFQNAVKEDAKDTRTWLRMAEVHVRLGQNEKATEVYQKTVDLYVEQGFFQRAVAVYKNIIKLSPEAVEARSRLADVYRQLGLFSDAIQQLEQAVLSHQKAGRLPAALSAMKEIIDLNPDQPTARIRYAEMAAQEGEIEQAVAEFRQAANLLKAQGRADEFIRVAERILYYQPDDQALGKELASCYLDRDNPRAALARLKPGFEANRNDPEILDLVARCFEQLGQPHKTVPVLKELCRVYASAGRMAERNQIIQRALALDPNDPEIQAMLGHTMSGIGQAPAASIPAHRRVPTLSNIVAPVPAAAPRSTAITFSEMEIPPSVRDKYETPSPDNVPSAADRMAIASGLVEKPEDDSEIQRILAEADVFVRYGLVERAADHLRHVFERVPTHVGAHERLAAVLTQLGRKAEAAAELEVLAQQLLPSSRADAATCARRALELNPSARRAREVLAAVDRMASEAAPPAPGVASAVAPVHEEATPEPEMIGSDQIELLGDGLSVEDEVVDNTGAVAALAEAFGSAEDDGQVQAGSGDFDEETTPATPANRPRAGEDHTVASNAPSAGSADSDGIASDAVLDDLAQVDFFIKQELNDEAQALLDELEGRHPGHILVADRRERLASLKKGAAPKGPLADKPTGRAEATPMPQAATRPSGSQDLDSEADLGLMNKSMDRHDLAIQHFTALLGDPKREVFALTMIGDCHEALGNHAEATRCFQDALRSTRATESEATQLYFLLGNVFYNTGDRAEALYYFERVAKRDPTFRDVQRRLAALKSRGAPH